MSDCANLGDSSEAIDMIKIRTGEFLNKILPETFLDFKKNLLEKAQNKHDLMFVLYEC